jgi:hypothetical protein
LSGVLARLHALASQSATGVWWVRDVRWLRIELVRGWVHAHHELPVRVEPEDYAALGRIRPPSDPQAAFRDRLIALSDGATISDSDEPRIRLGTHAPFHPARALRLAVTERLRLLGIDAQIDEAIASARLSIARPFHQSGLDPDEQRLATLLAESSLDLATLLARAGAAHTRVHEMLRQLVGLGALIADGRAIDLPFRALGEAARRAAAEKRRQYHAAAREVHPDLRPDASDEERARLTEEMAELASRRKKESPQ